MSDDMASVYASWSPFRNGRRPSPRPDGNRISSPGFNQPDQRRLAGGWAFAIEQFGSGFVAANPNSKIPALMDHSGPVPVRIFESGAILMHLAEKFGAFLPTEAAARAECLSWLFWQRG